MSTPDVQGDLRTHPLPRLLFLLLKRAFTGRLVLRAPTGTSACAYLRDGLPAYLDLPAKEDVLGQVLIEKGLIDANQYTASLAQLAQGGQLQGQILLAMGAVDERQLVEGLCLQLRRKLIRLFGWPDATAFALYAEEHGYGRAREAAFVRADPLFVIYHGVRNTYDQSQLERLLAPLAGAVVELTPLFTKIKDRFAFGEEDTALLATLACGSLSLSDILRMSNLSRTQTQMLIYSLWTTESLTVSGLGANAPYGEDPRASDDSASHAAHSHGPASDAGARQQPTRGADAARGQAHAPSAPPAAQAAPPPHRPALVPPPVAASSPLRSPEPRADAGRPGRTQRRPTDYALPSVAALAEAFSPGGDPRRRAEQVGVSRPGAESSPDLTIQLGEAESTPRAHSWGDDTSAPLIIALDGSPTRTQEAPALLDMAGSMLGSKPQARRSAGPTITPSPSAGPTIAPPPSAGPTITPSPSAGPTITPPPSELARTGPMRARATSTAAGLHRSGPPSNTSHSDAQSPNKAIEPASFDEPVPSSDRDGKRTAERSTDPESEQKQGRMVSQKWRDIQEQDHFQALGIDRQASPALIRDAFFALVKNFHPDKISGIRDPEIARQADEVFRRLSEANAILSDPQQRSAYLKRLESGVSEADERQAVKAALEAEFAFQKGMAHYRKRAFRFALEEFSQAYELAPDEGEHKGWYGWALFCDPRTDKEARLSEIKGLLTEAIRLAPKSAACHYFLGEVLLHEGQEKRAVASFNKALEINPNHIDAQRQLRLVEMRKQRSPQKGEKKSLLDRFRKK